MFIFRFGWRVVGCVRSFLDEHGPDLFLSPPAPEIGVTCMIDSWPFRERKDGPQTRILSHCCNPDARRARALVKVWVVAPVHCPSAVSSVVSSEYCRIAFPKSSAVVQRHLVNIAGTVSVARFLGV
jgi:hypothetical protein